MNRIIPVYVPAEVKGDVLINGINVKEMEPQDLARDIGLVMEDPSMQIISLTVFDEVAFGPINLGFSYQEIENSVSSSLKATRLVGLEQRNPRELSGGQQQALIIASILAMGTNIVSLDEPISALDPIGKTLVLSVLKDLKASGKTILLTESGSDLEYVINSGLIDKVILLEKGRVVAEGMPYEILSREDLLERCGIEPPGVTKLFFKLKKRFSDIKTIPVTVEEALKIMESWKFKLPERICPPPRFKLYKDRETIVLAKNVEFIYPNGVKALSGVDLEVREGSVVAIVGQNGSGKTTLAKILVGLYKPSNPGAKVIVDRIDLRNAPLNEVIKRINYVFQNPADQLFCDTVIEELTYGPRMLGMPEDWIKDRLNKIVKLFNLEDRLDSYIMSLTQGEKRLVAVASIAMLKPKVMIVDEVTGGLDMPDARKLLGALMRLNSEEGLTLMMITHDMRIAAEYSDQVVVMSNGRVVSAGTPREVFGKEIDMLKELSLMPPQITLLAYELSKRHREIPRDILSVDEFIEYIEDVR